jgi:hypothetical protein
MLYKTTLAGLACAICLATPAFAQHLEQWAPHASLGGAIGGYGIIGATPRDNAPLWALYMDRYAHVTGNYKNAIAKFDRVIKPDGSVVIMRRVSQINHPEVFGYLPKSWPGVAAIGKERIIGADGKVIAEREAIIPQSQIMAAVMPTDGPPVVTLAFERNIMSDGRMVVTASAQPADPGVALALLGSNPDYPALGTGARWDVIGKGIPWDRRSVGVAVASSR